jgi:hypothetical protein
METEKKQTPGNDFFALNRQLNKQENTLTGLMERTYGKDVKPALKSPEFSDKTAFKIVVWYSHHSDGTPFTPEEIKTKQNRKYHDSKDFIYSKNGWITRHDIAYQKLCTHVEKNRNKILTALLFCNDISRKKQYLISKYSKNNEFDVIIKPQFASADNRHVFFYKLVAEPLEIYELKHYKLSKKTQN